MKRILLGVFSLLCILANSNAQSGSAIQQYIDTYKELAINEEIRTGVPAAITLAQGIFESMAGQSELALASNNHFGIKCKENWTGGKVYHDDDARGECFRSYATVEESYRDHSDFLVSRPHYGFLFSLDPTNYEAWAHGLKKAGYATNPAYARLLIKKIEDLSLQQYTLTALQRNPAGNATYASLNTLPATGAAVTEAEVQDEPVEETLVEYSGEANYPAGVFAINKTKVMYAAAGTSLFALASNNNISYQKLMEFNDLEGIDILAGDQLIYLEKKSRKSNSREYHIVGATETIEDIARKEGIQLESLYEYNKMQKGLQPAAGEKVYLTPGRFAYYPKLLARNTSR